MSRRAFLRNLSLAAMGGVLAGCVIPPQEDRLTLRLNTRAYGDVAPPPPQAVADAAERDLEGDKELADFLALSALLTGVDELDPALGRVYRQSIEGNPELAIPVAELIERAKGGGDELPETLEELESAGFFAEEPLRALADKITEHWYTGIYETAQGEQSVATFVDALAWKTLTFTKAMTVCGTYRFWTEPPEAHLD